MPYVDGFLVPVPKKNLAAYRRMSQKAGKIWREHGALQFTECVADGDIDPCYEVATIECTECLTRPGTDMCWGCCESCGDGMCTVNEDTCSCPVDCGAVCGDGATEANEQCDDGDLESGDGVSGLGGEPHRTGDRPRAAGDDDRMAGRQDAVQPGERAEPVVDSKLILRQARDLGGVPAVLRCLLEEQAIFDERAAELRADAERQAAELRQDAERQVAERRGDAEREAADKAANMRAELLGELDQMAEQISRFADDAHQAGLICQRLYEGAR